MEGAIKSGGGLHTPLQPGLEGTGDVGHSEGTYLLPPPAPLATVERGISTGPLDNKSVKGYLDICSSNRISWD